LRNAKLQLQNENFSSFILQFALRTLQFAFAAAFSVNSVPSVVNLSAIWLSPRRRHWPACR
jgi:hypothetical protein